ncbi:MAG: hypothetical protein IT381_06940 [Deltaproteobacteria bacterium]|nr:hypothetical protein [Deltaproteobacteria bacterium]
MALALLFTGCLNTSARLDDLDAAAPLGEASWDCQSDEAFFRDTAWPKVVAVCAGCHQAGGQSGNTRFVLLPEDSAIADNLARVRDAAKLKDGATPLLLAKATNIITHGGGERVKKGSASYAILKHLLTRFDHPPTCAVGDPWPKTPIVKPVALADFDSEQTLAYLNKIAPLLVERFVGPSEMQKVIEKKGLAIPDVLKSFTEDPRLENAARRMIERLLTASGTRDGIDFSLPGNLAVHLVREKRPWSEILTAARCYDADDRAIDCDSGAPFTAGVLTTRAYLAGRASRFNLTRASTLMNAFACFTYPLPDDVQPRIDKTRLIPMFQATTPEEQSDDRATSGFGNGFGCYQCHGQFSLHAQLFVKFDRAGRWQAKANGLQDPEGELGNSTERLMTSHLNDPSAAAAEVSQVFGKPVQHLGDAAKVVASAPSFVPCAARKILNATTGTDAATTIDPALLAAIATAARARAADPTFADLVIATFSDPVVVASVLQGNQK